MTNFIQVTPAYGRDYKTKKEVLAAWNANLDFVIRDIRHSGYINREDVERFNADGEDIVIHVRYDDERKVAEMPS